MTNEEKVSAIDTTDTKPESGSPRKGFGLVIQWGWWIVQSFIAYLLAWYVWGGLITTPSVFDTSLSLLSISALIGIIKSGVTVFFKRVNYLYLYLSFFIGLKLAYWLLNLFIPKELLDYWWLPYLVIAPLILELPVIGLGITKFISWNLYSNVMWVAVATVSPYIFLYSVIYFVFHPRKSISYLKTVLSLSAILRIFFGVIACYFATRLIFKHLTISSTILVSLTIYLIIVVLVALTFGFFILLFNNQEKIKNLNRLQRIVQILIFPLWILTFVYAIPLSSTSKEQTSQRTEYFLTVPTASISVGLLAIAFLVDFVQPITLIAVYWAVNFFGAFLELAVSNKPSLEKTKIYKIFNFLVIVFILPFFWFSLIAAVIAQANNQASESKSSPAKEEKIVEQEAG
jgi:hypothetical protein